MHGHSHFVELFLSKVKLLRAKLLRAILINTREISIIIMFMGRTIISAHLAAPISHASWLAHAHCPNQSFDLCLVWFILFVLQVPPSFITLQPPQSLITG